MHGCRLPLCTSNAFASCCSLQACGSLPAACGDAVQAKKTGDLAVFELKSGFTRSKGVLVNKLSLVKTYRVAFSGLSIEAGVPGSATSIFAVATNSKAITQVSAPRLVAQQAAL
jgi:hypothetical protein